MTNDGTRRVPVTWFRERKQCSTRSRESLAKGFVARRLAKESLCKDHSWRSLDKDVCKGMTPKMEPKFCEDLRKLRDPSGGLSKHVQAVSVTKKRIYI